MCTQLWHGRTWKKDTRPYREKASTAVPEKKLTRPCTRKKVDMAVYTEEMLTRPWTHYVHLLISVRLHLPACTLIRPRAGRVYRIRTAYVPTIQDCLCFSQINTWMWKKPLKTSLTCTIENSYEKTKSYADGNITSTDSLYSAGTSPSTIMFCPGMRIPF